MSSSRSQRARPLLQQVRVYGLSFALLTSLQYRAHAGDEPAVAPEAPPTSAASVETLGSGLALERSERGLELYRAGQYRLALEMFEQAYAIDADPNLLFNMARCHHRLGEPVAAREKYEAFVAAPGAYADGVERARGYLLELASSAEVAPAPATVPTNVRKRVKASPRRRIWPWVTLGVGAALVGTGTVLYALGSRQHAALTAAPGYGAASAVVPIPERRAREILVAGDSKKSWGAVTASMGGALMATSLIWLVVDGTRREQSGVGGSSLRFTLVPTRRTGSFALSGSF